MYKVILVPLDGSRRAEAILPHVEHLARSSDASVVLLRVVEPFYDTVSPDGTSPLLDAASVVDEEISSAKAYLADLQIKLHEQGIVATQEVVFSASIVGTIIDVARREGADLIAMASHGRTGLARVFYGSVAVGVLHSVDRPLLLVRSRDGD
jgi:nucleotide-binding universal stress UspA family protein